MSSPIQPTLSQRETVSSTVMLINPDDAEKIMISMSVVQLATFAAYRMKNGKYLVVLAETLSASGDLAVLATIMDWERIERLRRERNLLIYSVVCEKPAEDVLRLLDVCGDVGKQ